MADPVRARRLTEDEGRKLLRITRRGKHESIRVRRATTIMASASGTPVTSIARLLAAHEDTWKDSTDPDFDTKLDRIEQVTTRFPRRCFAFDQFGPLSIRPHHGSGWAPRSRLDRLPRDPHPHALHPLLPRLLPAG
ncbi:hypothetical protein [Umezawaea tangerina]|uniref:Uncharacterized protein n=1 Tax=Umezawaea tangerina TaxID=84725 RepID=A0A2T0S6V8_9PSEU|nr:hypothetical protein [Umezawaea tangerina]PRY29150.1 hypothetical protein CLV43_12623 [Umezawaea tangerina]